MSKKEKKKHNETEHEEEINESWLLPYSDLMTLLLALFIVLFSISAVDSQKLEKVSEVFNLIFSGGTGIMDESAMLETDQRVDKNLKKERPDASTTEDSLYVLQEKINQYITENDLANQLNTSLTSEGLLVTINDSVFFDSGSAEVRKEGIDIAKEISNLLVGSPPKNVIISGHTDNVPIHNSTFASNWELSVMRAVNFMKIVLENPHLDPSTFSAKGYGEYNPIVSNDTEEGRAKNRRVEVLILPNISNETEQ